MRIESFDSAEEMFATLEERSKQALARLNPIQAALGFGSYVITPTPEGLLIFGQIPDEATLREIEAATYDQPMDASDLEEFEESIAATKAGIEGGHLHGKWFSTVEPEGEWGSHHKLNCWPIDEATFEWCHEVGWDYGSMPYDLQVKIRGHLDELMFHLFSAGRPS